MAGCGSGTATSSRAEDSGRPEEAEGRAPGRARRRRRRAERRTCRSRPGDRLPAGMTGQHVDIAIVGAGFGGLGLAINLERTGRRDFVVLERAGDVGGTWYANSYPGCQCDVPSNLYSFSFAPKPDWTHTYPEQPQSLDYPPER